MYELTTEQKQWLQDAVDRGVGLLNKVQPTWRADIRHRMETLRVPLVMMDCKQCILGFAMQGFDNGCDTLFAGTSSEDIDSQAAWHGFTSPYFHYEAGAALFKGIMITTPVWYYLEELWLAKLQEVN